MAKANKNSNYDLNAGFVDSSGNFYSTTTAKNLRLWCRMTPNSPTDLGPNSLSPAYDFSPTVSSVILGNKTYYSLVTNDTAGQAARVSATSGLLSFSSAASGGAPSAGTDRPFSISLWVKLDSLQAYQLLFTKDAGSGAFTQNEYRVNVDGSGVIEFNLTDINASAYQYVYYSSISAGNWYHLTFTYDGQGGMNAFQGMKIYVNGVAVSTTSSTPGTYVGMNPNHSFPLLIAQDADEADELDGQISEFAVWGTKLSATEVLAVYNATRNGAFPIGSGIISNPSRILLQEKDNHTGSYPTIARTGDPDFTGVYRSFFDDTDIISFVTNAQTVYPTTLPAISKWVSGGIATPNILQGLSTIGAARKGVSDAQVSFTPGENISPFNESRIYYSTSSAFYTTGTSNSVIPGFSQKLSSKTILQLDINPTVSTDIFFSTGSAVSGKKVHSGMVYFNWGSKKWEIVGNLTTGSNVDIFSPDPDVRSNAIHPAGGVGQFAVSPVPSDVARHVGIFHSTHGFPFATQYNSTGSQELSLTGTLSAPFLLEKVVLEWSGSFASWPAQSLADGSLNYQFFLLNVSPVTGSVTIVQDLTGSATGQVATSRNSTFNVNQIKDVVWAGSISRYYSALTASVPPLTYERDLNLVKMSADSTGISATTGTFRVESPAGIYGKNDGLQAHPVRNSTGDYYPLLANKIGFRNLGGFVEGKSFIRPIAASNPSGSFIASGEDDVSITTIYDISFIPAEDIRRDSPYILLPNHKLVLGFYGVPIQGLGNSTATDSWSERSASEHVTTLSPGAGKLTLYGSLLRGGLPENSQLNTPLTSDSIHEDIHYDNPVFDQFDVEPFEAFLGSYSDQIVTGSMLATYDVPARGSVTIVDATTIIANAAGTPDEVTLTSLDNTTKTYIFKTGTTGNLSSGKVIVSTDSTPTAATLAARLRSAIESGNGHDGKISTIVSTATVNLTQATGGAAGNTSITLQISAAEITAVAFSGGVNGSFLYPDLSRDVRKVQASVVRGEAGITGSLQRFVNLTSESDVLYDSYPPNVGTILSAVGKGLLDDGSGNGYLVVTTGTSYSDFDKGWYFRSAYEISSRRMTSFKISNIVADSYDGSGNLVNSNVSPIVPTAYITDESTGILRYAQLSAPGRSFNQSANDWYNLSNEGQIALMYKYLFGFGDNRFPNSTRRQSGPGVRLLYSFESIRGYKYGLAGLFGTYTNTCFRRDRYGQFRDMLEQPPNAAYLVANSVEYPLEVKFFSRQGKDGKGRQATNDPSSTHSQNLSPFATSSLPYFDGVARERSDDPDISLIPTTLS